MWVLWGYRPAIVGIYSSHPSTIMKYGEEQGSSPDWMEKDVLVEVTAFLLGENAKGKGRQRCGRIIVVIITFTTQPIHPAHKKLDGGVGVLHEC